MLTVQQAVFTVESLMGKVQQQKQLIHQLIQENEHLRHENNYAKKMNNSSIVSKSWKHAQKKQKQLQ
ncbi:transposase IS66 [Anoxybacillus ayderensis]|nr:transposase IS66 [Anoxybacillus ayderensis]